MTKQAEIETLRRAFASPSYTHERRGEGNAVCFYGDGPSFGAIAFSAARCKPDWHYTFRSGGEAARDKYIEAWLARVAERLTAKASQQAARDKARAGFVNPYKVGDLFHTHWGYDQTNVEFFECVAVGRMSITVREIGASSEATGCDQGRAKPTPGQFIGEPKRVILVLSRDGTDHHLNSPIHGGMWKTEPNHAHSWSSYA